MVEKSELLRVPTFQGLPDDQLDWFLSYCQEVKLKPGDVYLRPGGPTDSMVVVLEGELQVRGELAGETVRAYHSGRGLSLECCPSRG